MTACSTDGYELVKANPRWGSQRVNHAGLDYIIGREGTWMPAQQAVEIIKFEKDVYCGRVGGVVRVKPLYIARATIDEVRKFKEA